MVNIAPHIDAAPDTHGMSWPTVAICIACGAVGGMSPTVAKLAATYAAAPETPPPGFGLLIGLLLFAFLGGIVGLAFGQLQFRQAFIAGIAAPGIITNVLAGTSLQQTAPPVRTPVAVVSEPTDPPAPAPLTRGIATAQAQPATAAAQSITIVPRVTGGLPQKIEIPVTAVVAQPGGGDREVRIATITSLSTPTVVSVPPNTRELSIQGKRLDMTAVGAKRTIALTVVTRAGVASDLQWALGGQRSYSIQELSVDAQ
jgi:hypothetical protein